MNPKFVVKTTINAECQKEASEGLTTKATKILSIVITGFLVILFAVAVWQYIAFPENRNLFFVVIPFFALVYVAYLKFYAPKTQLRRWEESIARTFGTNCLHVQTEFYDLILSQIVEESGSEDEEGYSALKEFKETKNLFLLRGKGKTWFFLAKDGFTVGDPDSFRTFINSLIQK